MTDTKKYFDACVASIAEIVKFDSSQAPALPGMPFGQGTADCLAFFLELANSFGFETHNYDNYVGEVVFGEGEEFAILAHLDVVPAGKGWTKLPFGGEICGGKLYGRGTMDDKGPAVICLYCLRVLKESGFVPKKKIKLIVGCNEESGWACIDHYNRCAHMPEIGFTPDADFPAIYAEKGILHFETAFPLPRAPFTSLNAGERANMVCDYAVASGADGRGAEKFGLTCHGDTVEARGKSAHASTPEKGVNALGHLLAFFAEQDERVRDVWDIFFGDKLGLRRLHDETGSLTMSADVARYEEETLYVTTDIRYPATYKQEQICAILDKMGAPYTLLHCQAPLYNDKDGFLISTLQRVYREQTGRTESAIAIGGGTYARAIKNGAGFGPQFSDEPSTIHQKDEYITLENVQKLLDIYTSAIFELTK